MDRKRKTTWRFQPHFVLSSEPAMVILAGADSFVPMCFVDSIRIDSTRSNAKRCVPKRSVDHLDRA